MERQIEAVRAVLDEIGAGEVPEVLAVNKIDVVDVPERGRLSERFPDASLISSLAGEGLDELLERVAVSIPRFPVTVTVLLPLERGDLIAMLHREAEVLMEEPREDGVLVRVRAGERVFAAIREHALREDRAPAPSAGG